MGVASRPQSLRSRAASPGLAGGRAALAGWGPFTPRVINKFRRGAFANPPQLVYCMFNSMNEWMDAGINAGKDSAEALLRAGPKAGSLKAIEMGHEISKRRALEDPSYTNYSIDALIVLGTLMGFHERLFTPKIEVPTH